MNPLNPNCMQCHHNAIRNAQPPQSHITNNRMCSVCAWVHCQHANSVCWGGGGTYISSAQCMSALLTCVCMLTAISTQLGGWHSDAPS